MFTFFVILIVAVVCGGTLLWLRKRKKSKSCIREGQRHPTGYLKYHEQSQTVLRKALTGEDLKAKGLEVSSATEPGLKTTKDKDRDAAPARRAVATLTFKGDMRATGRHTLSHLIDEIVLNRERIAEVVIKIESPGGSVTDYGHCYAEIARLRQADLKVTACVDSVAASGGYLMCLPADKIVAAPFAMVGSIGVVSFIPNVRRLLEKLNIQPRTFTAGEFKRTVTMTDDSSPEQEKHYLQQLQLIHDQFKRALSIYRPQVDLTKVATGEAWLAATAVDLKLGLVDEIGVSAEYLLEKNQHHDIVEFSEKPKRKRWLKLAQSAASLFDLPL